MFRPVTLALVSLGLALTGVASAAQAEAACDLAAPPLTPPAAGRTLQPKDLLALRDFGYGTGSLDQQDLFDLSPDGGSIALQIRQADPVSNRVCVGLVVVDVEGRRPARLVDQGEGFITFRYNHSGWLDYDNGFPKVVWPRWSPDGSRLAHLRSVDGVTQLWVTNADGASSRAITRQATNVHDFAWRQDGRSLVFAAYSALVAANAAIDREGTSGYLYDDRINPLRSARPIAGDLTRDVLAVDVEGLQVAPGREADLALLPGEVVAGRARAPAIFASGPHGETAGFGSPVTADKVSAPTVFYLRAAGRPPLTCDAPSCAEGIVGVWFKGPGDIRFLRREGWGRSELAMYGWRPGRDRPRRLFRTEDLLLGCKSLGAALICAHEGSLAPRRLVRLDPDTGKMRVLYDPNPEFGALRLGRVERLKWKTADGVEAFGDLVLPPDHRPGERHPLVVVQYETRGFLRGGTGDEYPIQAFAARGFAVLSFDRPRPAHSTVDPSARMRQVMDGWADRWTIHRALVSGVDLLVKRGVVDPSRVGITGFSDGGTTAQFALINSKIFSAAAISACCYEPVSTMSVVGGAWARTARSWGWPGLSAPDPGYWKPMSFAANAGAVDTPLLMQLPDNEYVAALEGFAALKEMRKPVEMYVFPNEFHAKWQPLHRLAVYERALDWFDFWLNGAEQPNPTRTPEYERWRKLRQEAAQASRTAAIGS